MEKKRRNVPLIPLAAFPLAKNWIAGAGISEAINYSKMANSKNLYVVLNYLGEEIESKDGVQKALAQYMAILDLLDDYRIRGCISPKLSQLGLKIDADYCRVNFLKLVKHANEVNRFVWVDMENSRFTTEILKIYYSSFASLKSIGVCIQAQLKRSKDDVKQLLKIGGKTRLVKGIYNEPPTAAFKSRREIDSNFTELLKMLFQYSGNLFSISTHDDKLIEEAIAQSKIYPRDFEFGFLKGVRDGLKAQLVRKGYRVTEYVPYGESWLPYSFRRMKEKPSNIVLLARSLLAK